LAERQDLQSIWDLKWLPKIRIVASNDINEEVLHALAKQGHSIDAYGIGTNLVTCQAQPALGCVYKLVEVNGKPRIKLSNSPGKVTLPGRKNVYRLYNDKGQAVLDYMSKHDEPAPEANTRLLCRHPSHNEKKAYFSPSKVEPLLKLLYPVANTQNHSSMARSMSMSNMSSTGQPPSREESISSHISQIDSNSIDKDNLPSEEGLETNDINLEAEMNVTGIGRTPSEESFNTSSQSKSDVKPVLKTLQIAKETVIKTLNTIREDTKRHINPTPYKVSLSTEYFNFFRRILDEETPVGEL